MQVSVSVEDPHYHGLELDITVFYYKHNSASKRHVAFEGTAIGRRFLACAEHVIIMVSFNGLITSGP